MRGWSRAVLTAAVLSFGAGRGVAQASTTSAKALSMRISNRSERTERARREDRWKPSSWP